MSFIRPINTKGQPPKITNGYSAAHTGIDYAYVDGEPIYASESGIISIAKGTETRKWLVNTDTDPFPHPRALNNDDYGNMIKIDHNDGYSTLYAHLKTNSVLVTKGQKVDKGQKIGEVGSTGNSTGNHLHWEIRKNNITVDPTPITDTTFTNYFINSGQPTNNNMNDQDKKDIESMKALRNYKSVWYEAKHVIEAYEALEKERNTLGLEISKKDTDIKTKQETINSLNQLVTEKGNQIIKANSTISTLEHQLLEAESRLGSLEEQAKKIPEMQEQLSYLEDLREVWNKKETSYKKEIETLSKDSLKYATLGNLIKTLVDRLLEVLKIK